MVRALLGLFFVAGIFFLLSNPRIAVAQKGGNSGTLARVDAKAGVIAINMLVVMKKKRELTDKEYFLNDDAKVIVINGGEKKTMTGKAALATGALVVGTHVSFVPDGDLKIKELTIGGAASKK